MPPGTKLNTPELRSCFFCQQEKLCVLIHLPPDTIEMLKWKHGDDPVMVVVVDLLLGKSYFTRCEDCEGRTDWAKDIVGHLLNKYRLVRVQLKEGLHCVIDEAHNYNDGEGRVRQGVRDAGGAGATQRYS